ncbi:MAG TPA: hypothetical protein PLL36_01545 [Candidatus Hydrogenedentes bacterium]|nr:MAG: hypothetical protein BWX80_01015 [Candidatus Hydrogenedentes bacterium ADurb.Bin101]HOC69266.1 hypothetical protein [Candidatus Hydrogenedentota bacterium]HQM99724.1 hypothetical protein [Candidatus Hydrogenedentota bacterium]
MKRKRMVIGLFVIALSSMAFAEHTPVPDLDSCPATADEYGSPIAWNFVPLPLFNINILGSTVNFTPIEGQTDFCAYADIVFCSLNPIAGIVPEVLQFASLVQCLTMDINGPLNLEAEIPVAGNGIPDGSYELGILASLYNAGDAEVIAAYQANYQVIKDLIVDALAAYEMEMKDKDIRSLVQQTAPYLVRALTSILAGFTTMADEDTNAALDQLLLLLAEIGIAPPEGGIEAITTGIPRLGPEGDADSGGASNRREYEYYVTELGYTAAEYVAAALDPLQEPPLEEGEGEPVEGEPVEGEIIEGEVVEGESGEDIPHPADLNVDWNVVMSEAIAYLSGWQQGINTMPNAIRAAYIWQNGQHYAYDAQATPPMCWILAPLK